MKKEQRLKLTDSSNVLACLVILGIAVLSPSSSWASEWASEWAAEDATSYAGHYFGVTTDNQRCQVGVPEGLRGAISIQITDHRDRPDGCIFMAKKIVTSPGVAKAYGTNGRYRCKVRLNLNEDGSIESADLAFGGILNLGYNAKCLHLKELSEF